jgi:hypothetical protein
MPGFAVCLTKVALLLKTFSSNDTAARPLLAGQVPACMTFEARHL